MARFAAGLVAGFVIATVAGAAVGLHADETAVDVREAAAAAGVSELDLKGAVNTTGQDPWTYLRGVGELPPLEKKPSPIPDKWVRLVQCEASGDWHNARNPIYKGGPQFDPPTWARYGGLAFAPRADFATPAQQVIVAERTLAAQGPAAWPVCGPRTGLR